MARVKRPLDRDAVAAADDAFYAKHPELVQDGKRIPLSPSDPAQAELRRQWVALYQAQLDDDDEPPKPNPKAPDDPVQPCPDKPGKAISGRFVETELGCCEDGHVEADGVEISEGAATTFKIYRVRDNKPLTSVSGPMNGQQVRGLVWRPKRPDDHEAHDKFMFDVSADGVSNKSANQFGFKEYTDHGPDTKTIDCSSPPYAWTGKFDIAYDAGKHQITVTVKIKLLNMQGEKPASGDPMPDVGDPVSDADKSTMKADVEGKLSDKLKLTRDLCKAKGCGCPVPIKIVVDFVENGEHHEVRLFQGSGRANASNWTRVKTRANSYAHETGHLLGWYDEYTGGATGSAPRWKANEPANVMNVGLTVPAEYGWDFRDWFKEKTGENWSAEKA